MQQQNTHICTLVDVYKCGDQGAAALENQCMPTEPAL